MQLWLDVEKYCLGGYPFGNMSSCRSCVLLMRPLHGADQGDSSDLTVESVASWALWALHPQSLVCSFNIFLGRIEKRATVRSTKQKGRCLFINEASKTLASSTYISRFTHQFSHSSSKASWFRLLLSPSQSNILFQTPHPLEFKSWCARSMIIHDTCDRLSCLSFPKVQ